MDVVLNISISVVSLIVALVAIFQTQKQIKLSNRQQLFDRRLGKYMIIKDLLMLFSKNQIHIVGKEELIKVLTLQFSWLTNVTYLSDMVFAINEPLNSEKQNILLSKCEMLEKYALEISVLWKDKTGEIFSSFVRTYKEMLFKMYQQQICIEHYREFNENQNGIIELMITGEKLDNALKENASNIELFETIQELDSIHNKIINENLEQELINSLKL